MRIESSVTSVSWIPSEVPTGLLQAGINIGLGHADPPPPEVIEDLEALFAAERFRFANHLAAWIDVTDGVVVGAGYSGRGYISRTRVGGRAGGPACRCRGRSAAARMWSGRRPRCGRR
jgi:hypothetical protein